MKARFRLNGKEHEGRVIQRNPLTTLVQVRFAKMDVWHMHWHYEIRTIKRHNIKHDVRFL